MGSGNILFIHSNQIYYIGNQNWLKENEETAKSFLGAVKKGYEFAIDNADEAADILCQAAPELDKEMVLASQKYMAGQYQAEADQWGYIDPERWNAFYSWISETNKTLL